MGPPSKTPISRKDKALATRRRMLKAAYDTFCERGWAATTMDLIAKKAGVAVQTLYFTFHTKGSILNEAVGAGILGFDRWDPRVVPAVEADTRKAFAEHHPWFADFERAKSARAALHVFIDASLQIFVRLGPLVHVMAEAAASDPGMKAAADLGERRRLESYRVVVEHLAKHGGLRRGVTVQRGTDILLTLLSAETYQQLVGRRAWTNPQCARWFRDVLAQQLLPS